MKINLQSRKRKELADHIGEILGTIPRYLGVPTCNYQIGDCILERDGTLTISDNIDAVELFNHLKERGWESGETETNCLTISVPRDTLPDEKIAVLEQIIAGKASLLKKAIGTDTLTTKISGEKISFPWFPYTQDSDEIRAYTELITKLCEMANRQKRTGAVKETDNEKYTFRCFLLRLGMIGTEYKTTRKILLRNLTGNSAYRNFRVM
mgnify:FL=1